MTLLNFTMLRLAPCLIIGIVIAHHTQLNDVIVRYTTIGLIAITSIYWFILRQTINRKVFFPMLVYLSMVAIGIHAYSIHDEKLQPLHYTNSTLDEGPYPITFKIKERLKPDSYNDKYIASIASVNQVSVSGKVLVNVNRDSAPQVFPVDALIHTVAKLQDIQKPLNPYQFDYSSYLELKHVYGQLYIKNQELLVISNSPQSIYGLADQLRTTINNKLARAGFKNDVLGIINALLLGQRQSIDKSTYNNYVNSGTIHIFAVSGLHIGIILLILNFLFRPLLYLKYGYVLRPLIIVILLWLFAIIAGLSPSVTRAVTMFSIISIAMHLKRSTNIYNTLAISAFFILLMKPTFLFEVGFQMSYLAVLGIVSFQPIIYRLFQTKYWVIDKLWQIFTVTLAAQIGVVPISLYYFHQFPGLFFISNLVIIPFLGIILGAGLLIIVLALVDILHPILVNSYSLIIDSLNTFIAWVAQFEGFLFRDIPFTLSQVICSYFIIFTFYRAYKTKSFRWISLCLIGIIGLQGTYVYNNLKTKADVFIVFNKSRSSMIGIKENNKLIVHHNLDSSKLTTDNIVKNYKIGENIKVVETDSLQNLYRYNSNTILIIDSLGIYKALSFKPDYIVLRNSPRINLNRLIDHIHPRGIIADASNFKSYVKRWKATCRHKKIPFHYTNEKGAFILH